MKYRFVVDNEVLDLFVALSLAKRERLIAIFQSLADSAPMILPQDHQDSTGRAINRKEFVGCTVWFWYDSPVKEVRIVDVEVTWR